MIHQWFGYVAHVHQPYYTENLREIYQMLPSTLNLSPNNHALSQPPEALAMALSALISGLIVSDACEAKYRGAPGCLYLIKL
jgi:hypothetical protein